MLNEDSTNLTAEIIRDICELPDRTSPDDWPEAMIVTPEELTIILERHFAALTNEAAVSREAEPREAAQAAQPPCHICGAIYPSPHGTLCSAAWPDDPKRYWPGEKTQVIINNVLAALATPPATNGEQIAESANCSADPIGDAPGMVERLRAKIINTPETADFMAGVPLEAAHQRERWHSEHDAGKEAEDWFWLLGYLGGKALSAAKSGDLEKAKHHTISTAAALVNWHASLSGADTRMRPGIEPPDLNNLPLANAMSEPFAASREKPE